MYLNHFGLTEAPFRITPHTDFFFSGANRGATLEALLYAITQDEGIVKVTGEVGSGKTMLCRVLIERLPPEVETVYLANPSLEREEILQAILDDLKFNVAGEQRAGQLLRTLQEHLIALYGAGKRVVLLIDEAHAMPPETLEQIRLLSNLESSRHKLLQIALFGQQELDQHLGTVLLRPLRERITHSFRLDALVHADVGQYLMFRLRQAGYKGPDLFDRDALKLIAKSSEGLTRRLNILADKCLLAAYAEGVYGITRKQAQAAIRDSGFAPLGATGTEVWPPTRRHIAVAAAAIALAAGGVVTGMTLSASSNPSAPAIDPAAINPAVNSIANPAPGPASGMRADPPPSSTLQHGAVSEPQKESAGTPTSGTAPPPSAATPSVPPPQATADATDAARSRPIPLPSLELSARLVTAAPTPVRSAAPSSIRMAAPAAVTQPLPATPVPESSAPVSPAPAAPPASNGTSESRPPTRED